MYIELFPPKPEYNAQFGNVVAVSGDGRTLAVASPTLGMNNYPVSIVNSSPVASMHSTTHPLKQSSGQLSGAAVHSLHDSHSPPT
jgi:hypothetical protein